METEAEVFELERLVVKGGLFVDYVETPPKLLELDTCKLSGNRAKEDGHV